MSTTYVTAGPLPALATSAHLGPSLAVTTITALLAVSADVATGPAVLVTAAVLAGQLTIGWGNDLADVARDRAVGRTDKPLATGGLSPGLVRAALVTAAVLCLVLSVAAGWRSAAVHLLLVVGMGHAYNLGLKATVWSWVPYAVAFGALPAVVSLAADQPRGAPWWLLGAGATLGVGAHLVNALPDLADDERTGVRGLPHRLGATGSRLAAALLLGLASLLAALGPDGAPRVIAVVVLVGAGALVAVAVVGHGRRPFQAAVGIALLDVVLLVLAGR